MTKTIFTDIIEFFKMQIAYDKTCKEIDKVFKENMVQDKKTGVWRNKEMAKKELKEQLKSYEGYINDIPLVIDPCKMCKKFKENGERFNHDICRECCWFYDSKFEIGVSDNSCRTCKHYDKITSGKEPCHSCDNGNRWEE